MILGWAYIDLDKNPRAMSLLQEACALVKHYNTLQEEEVFAKASLSLGELLRFAARYEEAAAAYLENLAMIKNAGHRASFSSCSR